MSLAKGLFTMKFTIWLLALIGAALISGCASMSKEECLKADWLQVGHRDGAAGQDGGRLNAHTKACAEAGVVPDANRWTQGWNQGVLLYCTPQVGWREGRAGNTYRGVCVGRGEEAFLYRFRLGSELHRVEGQLSSNQSEIHRLEDKLSKSKSEEERRSLRDRVRILSQEQVFLRQNLNQLQLMGLQP